MPDGGVSEEAIGAAIFDALDAVGAASWTAAGIAEVAAIAASAYMSYQSAIRAKDAYNASLRDRYVMQRTSTGQRALVLGRVRVSGPIAFMQSYGSNQTTLAIVVVLAAHQCDAIEKIYFNDAPITLDANNNVLGVLNTEHFSVNSSTPLTVFLAQPAQGTTVVATAQYADATIALSTSLASDNMHLTLSGARATGVADVKVTYQPTYCQYTPGQLLDQQATQTATAAAGSYTFPNLIGTLQNYPGYKDSVFVVGGTIPPSVVVVQTVSGQQTALTSTCTTGSSGYATSVSWTGATVGAALTITFQAGIQASRARVRQYLGAPGQTADATLISNLPGEWTTAHVGNGICYLVCEFDYDPSSYPAGLPNVSAVVRGAQLYDPRTSTTAWTQNPAVMARGYWTHPLGANQPSTSSDDASIIAAANVCDTTTTYLLGTGLIPQPAPLYTAGTVATKDLKPQDVLDDLCMAMGGRWVITGNKLRVKAGAYTAPVAAIDNSWLTGESSISVVPLPPRQSLFNAAQGTFCDSTNDYRAVLYPKQIASALVTADGRELDLDITYQSVTTSGQAQYLSACAIRYNRAGMSVKLACNLRAFPLEVFDVVTLTLPRFGFVAQTFEVTDTSFTPEGLVLLSLKYITSSIWALDSSYQLPAYAPKTVMPSPWNVGVPVLGIPQSGTAQLLKQADGTIVSRIYVPLSISDSSVLSSGFMDVAYIDAANAAGTWNTVTVSGNSAGTYLAPVQDGHTYLIKARGRNTLTASAWTASTTCLVAGQSAAPTAVTGLTTTIAAGYVYFFWTPNTDADYKQTVIQYGPQGTTGNVWGSAGMTQPFAGAASTYGWPSPGPGTYEFQVRHYNFSGIATASATVVVTSPASMAQSLSAAGTTATWSDVTGAGLPANNATADLVLIARGNCSVTGNTGTKVGGSALWDSDIYSADSYTGGAYASFVVPFTTGNAFMVGLNSDPLTDESYTSLDYAWYVNGTALGIYENGVSILSGLTAAVGDVLVVLYDGAHVSYYQNGALARVVGAAAGLKLFLDSSFCNPGSTANNIRFGPQTSIGGITMSANGTLSGAGGGAVTITGLGTTGAVGSGNIFPNGDFLASAGGVPTNVNIYNNASIAYTATVVSGGPIGTSNYLQLTANAAGATDYGMLIDAPPFGGFKGNTNYVVSFYATASGAMAGAGFRLGFNHSPVVQTWLQNPALISGTWQRYVVLLNWGTNTVDVNVFFAVINVPGSGNALDFACVQVEQGDAPSGWAPASYVDANGAIQGVQGGAGTTVANTQISVNGSGVIGGIGTGTGTAVANSLLTAPIAAAATTAVWSSVSSTPANLAALTGTESIANADTATSLGFNPAFSAWTGTYPVGWGAWGPSTPTRSAAYNTTGMQQGVVWTVSSADVTANSSGMYAQWSNTNSPLAAGAVLTGSYSIEMLVGSTAAPGYLIRLYTNSGLTTYVDNIVGCPHPGVSGWQKVPFTATAGGAAIYGITIFQMAGWNGMPGGMTAAGTSMVFGPFEFNIDLPVGTSQAAAGLINTSISVDGSGLLQGIGSGAGTAVSNGLLTASIADKLSASTGGILSSTVSLGATAGAGFVAGTLTWTATGAWVSGYGVAMTPGGIVAYNSSGVPEFTLSATTGSAYFAGTLAANTVSTSNVQASAITNPVPVTTSGGLISSGTRTVCSGSITTTGGYVLLVCNVQLSTSGSPATVGISVVFNGSAVFTESASGSTVFYATWSGTLTPAAGTYSFSITCTSSSTTTTVTSAALTPIEIKR